MLSKFDVSPWTSLSTHMFTGLSLLYTAISYNLILNDIVTTFGQIYRWKHEDNCVTLFNLPEKPEQHYEYRIQYQSIYWLAPITPSALSSPCPSSRKRRNSFKPYFTGPFPVRNGDFKNKKFLSLDVQNRNLSLPLTKPQSQEQDGGRYVWFSQVMLDLLVSSSK